MKFDDPKPTGMHRVAIDSLDNARKAMGHIAAAPGVAGEVSLGDLFDKLIAEMIATIDHDYRRRWREAATEPPQFMLDEELMNARVVFWYCEDHPKGKVEWTTLDGSMEPRCLECGKTGPPR